MKQYHIEIPSINKIISFQFEEDKRFTGDEVYLYCKFIGKTIDKAIKEERDKEEDK